MPAHEPAGRPLKFENAAALQQKIDEYFGSCDPHIAKRQVKIRKQDGSSYWAEEEYMTEQEPYGIVNLAYYLDCSRQTLLNYESGKYDNEALDATTRQEIVDTIKRAKLKVEAFNERALHRGQMVAGIIFTLKNNHDWIDRKELTGKDGESLTMSPADAAAIQSALETVANGNSVANGADQNAVPAEAESTGVQPTIPESHPEAAA